MGLETLDQITSKVVFKFKKSMILLKLLPIEFYSIIIAQRREMYS